jgi:hypothetical protein
LVVLSSAICCGCRTIVNELSAAHRSSARRVLNGSGPRSDLGSDLQEIRVGLAMNAEGLALSLLGEPTSQTEAEWRWRRKGSFSMVMRRPKHGLWHNHEAGEGGDLLKLIQRNRESDFQAALDFARAYLRMPEADRPRPRIVESAVAQTDNDAAARIARARCFATKGVPVDGTPAESYLIHQRSIPKPESGWPDAVRFHPWRVALMMLATDVVGKVRAVQFVHLTEEGAKLPDEPNRPTKQSFGMVSGAAVRLPGRAAPLTTKRSWMRRARRPACRGSPVSPQPYEPSTR